ncbi:MAG: Xaa-Pro peptidase family protein, partial [Chloroflexota bacterium]|nr:Xaa-Pro peptidase family protein [Chloroflexota bacterium]
ALVPGPNLFYFTGLSFHLSERPILLLLPTDRAPALVAPGFEALKAEGAPVEMEVFPYTDEEGYKPAFENACAALGLAGCTIGAETFTMRLVEARLLERYAPGCRLLPAEELLAEQRMRKDDHELAHMRRAIAITETALGATMQQVRAGMTELEVVALLSAQMLQAGAETISFIIVQGGPNAASPHAVPGDRPIQPGDTILIDCGVTVGGYNSDITRTFCIGALDEEMARVYEIVRAANTAGRAVVRPGAPAEAIDQAARAVIEEAGYGEYFIHRTGHGLGLEVHEPPYIVAGNERLLETGMTFTVEPGIYLPGRGGVRIEDDVLVTPDGAESLTTFPRELVTL